MQIFEARFRLSGKEFYVAADSGRFFIESKDGSLYFNSNFGDRWIEPLFAALQCATDNKMTDEDWVKVVQLFALLR